MVCLLVCLTQTEAWIQFSKTTQDLFNSNIKGTPTSPCWLRCLSPSLCPFFVILQPHLCSVWKHFNHRLLHLLPDSGPCVNCDIAESAKYNLQCVFLTFSDCHLSVVYFVLGRISTKRKKLVLKKTKKTTKNKKTPGFCPPSP